MSESYNESDEDRLRHQVEWAADVLQAGREVLRERADKRAEKMKQQRQVERDLLQFIKDAQG